MDDAHSYRLIAPEILSMRGVSLQRAVNSAVWISSGIILIGVRAALLHNIDTIAEILGVGMIIFGMARLFWAVVITRRSEPQ